MLEIVLCVLTKRALAALADGLGALCAECLMLTSLMESSTLSAPAVLLFTARATKATPPPPSVELWSVDGVVADDLTNVNGCDADDLLTSALEAIAKTVGKIMRLR